jgi:hypothetical protein
VNGSRFFAATRALAAFALAGVASAQTIDVVGGTTNPVNGSARAKGNAYEVTAATNLTLAEFYLDFAGPQTLRTTVHSCATEFGSYSQIFETGGVVNGAGAGWYSNGAIQVPLAAGTYYLVAVSWSGTLRYFYTTGDSQPVSFGSHVHGYASGAHPLPGVFSSSVNDQAIYHQRLTSQSGPIGPIPYCTPGTTTSGCAGQVSASDNPSVGGATPCQIAITGLEGQKTGIVFYGLSSLTQSWCSLGGSSTLCVKAPTMRTGVQFTGGTSGQCDGQLALDWDAFQSSNPGALGAPWSAGDKAFVQGWFRDPPACKTTFLSEALDITYAP